MHPLSVQIITRDHTLQKEIHQNYVMQTRYPRLQLLNIFLRALFTIRFR